MKTEKIKSRNFIFTYSVPDGWNLNLHLIRGRKYNFIIDTGLGSLSVEPIRKHLEGDGKPVIVINTHYHWDHIWGNGAFPDSAIISHKLCREMIESNWEEMLRKFSSVLQGEAEMRLPTLTFEQELYFPEDGVRLIYTPGHTADSISVIDEVDRVLNAGDNIGDTADDIIPSLNCEREVYIDTLVKYRELDFDLCVSGHNIVLSKGVEDKILSLFTKRK